jgi:hypothetical protein
MARDGSPWLAIVGGSRSSAARDGSPWLVAVGVAVAAGWRYHPPSGSLTRQVTQRRNAKDSLRPQTVTSEVTVGA